MLSYKFYRPTKLDMTRNKVNVTYLMLCILAAITLFVAGCSTNTTPDDRLSGQQHDDKVITQHVEDALSDASPAYGNVTVHTYKQIVQLSGNVSTAAEKQQATNITARVPGVKSVRNDIMLRTAD